MRWKVDLGSYAVERLETLLKEQTPLVRLRLWPYEIGMYSQALDYYGYRLRHIANAQDGDKGRDLAYETVWEVK